MKYFIVIIAALLFTPIINAQTDFFGNLRPMQTRKVVNLPDKPNAVDNQGRKQGEWAKKYSNGRYIYLAKFVDNFPVDTVVRFYDSGIKSTEQIYISHDSCMVNTFNESGEKEASGLFVNNKKSGVWIIYNAKGYVVEKDIYVNGNLHGTAYVYYDDGSVFEEKKYSNGVLNGAWNQFYRGGARQLKATYNNGNLDGLYHYWDNNGKSLAEGQYDNGKKIGNWKIFDSDENAYFFMKYDKNGNLINKDELENKINKRLNVLEQNSKLLQDPEMYVNSPDDYRP